MKAVGLGEQKHRDGADEQQGTIDRLAAELVSQHPGRETEDRPGQDRDTHQPADLDRPPLKYLVIGQEGHQDAVEHPGREASSR